MRFIIQIVAISIGSFIVQQWLPWYSIAIVSGLVGFTWPTSANFLGGFMAISLLWFLMITFSATATPRLYQAVTEIFNLPSVWILKCITCCFGGIIGGLACLTGSLYRVNKENRYYN
jgi:hypothetical protein